MLSPQTKDAEVARSFNRLSALAVAPDAPLLPMHVAEMSVADVESAVRTVSFFRTKAANIKTAALVCAEKYGNDIPAEMEALLAFPGVGPKVGFLTFTIAWGRDEGICVDTHVHRITQRLGWVGPSKQPEKTRVALQALLPRDLWGQTNDRLVRFGQTICEAKQPKCSVCLLSPSCLHYNDGSNGNMVPSQ